MNTTIVPPAPERTRDMGSAEQHSPARPPFLADCVKQLGDLERWFGTELFDEALRSYQDSPEFEARKRGVAPDQLIRDIRACLRGYGDAESEAFADRMEAKARLLPVAAPYPGAATVPAQSTPTAAVAA